MCGIVGIYSQSSVAEELYDSLIHLQHRGQDGAGILTSHTRFNSKNALGLVKEIFSQDDIHSLRGKIGIAHTRYPTAGSNTLLDVQPMWIGSPLGIALAHNGNLMNYKQLAAELSMSQHRHLNSSTDSEILLHLLAEGLAEQKSALGDTALFFDKLCGNIQLLFEKVQGSFSVVSVILGKGLLAFRDPHGIRPLVWGERINEDQSKDYIFASESTMFYSLGFELKGDVQPGEVIFIDLAGHVFQQQLTKDLPRPCIFEYVYFARPDAILNTISVYRARLSMGKMLALRWKEKFPQVQPDVIIPIPFTSNTAALAMAQALGVQYSEGLYKNSFIGRTFIMPGKKQRRRSVRYKLTPQRQEIQGKKVLLLDDSIVRGTTSRETVKMMREYGAKEVYFASAAPPIKEPCFYGIDIPSHEELIAANYTIEQIQQFLDVDALLYQTTEDLVQAINYNDDHPRTQRSSIKDPCMACMNGCYVTGDLSQEKMQQLKLLRAQDKEIG